MDITRAAIEKNRVTIMALLLITVGGVGAYTRMSRAEDPGFTIRAARVITFFPGAGPERVENLVTDPLEKAIQEIPELDFLQSESRTGISVITVNILERYADMRPIWDNLRRKVERAASDLPDGIIGPQVNDEFGDVFGTIVTLRGDGFRYAELKEYADQVRDELLRLSDVAKVEIHGAQEEQIFIEYNNARLAELGLTPLQLTTVLESVNIIIPGGAVEMGTERIVLEPSGNFESLQDLRRTVISLPGRSELVYLEDLAAITRGYVDPPSRKVRSSGLDALALAISMREGGNIIDLGTQIETELERLQRAMPLGIEFDVVAFQPERVDRKVSEFVVNLLQAVAIVLAVMLLFLGFRTGLVVASLVPMAMIMSLLAMSFFEIGLDQMSLAALIIALGMLVDNAIVMAESIMVQMESGKPAVEAAVQSASELRIPLLTSSLTTAAAFLPIYLAESTTGEYTAPLFKVVSITLLCSWLLALTMIPLLCVLFLRVSPAADAGYDSRFYRLYRRCLVTVLRFRFVSLAAVAGIFWLALLGLNAIPNVFFPASDVAIFTAEFELPTGTAIARTEQVLKEVEEFMSEQLMAPFSDADGTPDGDRPAGEAPGIVNWVTFIGTGAPRFYLSFNPKPASPNYAMMLINATSREIIEAELIPSLEDFCNQRYPDLKTTLNPLQLGPPVQAPVQIRLSGTETGSLFEIADLVKARVREVPGTKNVGDDWGRRTKKLSVEVNQARARRAGVTSQDIAISLQTTLSGIETTQFREQDTLIPVTLRSVAADRQDIGKLETLDVYAQLTGRSVPLLQVADLAVNWEPAKILRRDRLKTVTISSELEPGVTATQVTSALRPWLDETAARWPLGYLYEFGGELETSVKANQAIGAQLPIAGLIILILLVGQFNSVRRTLIILMTIPLALIGVIIGLLAADSYFGFMTLLGIISLAGIVINNAIVLIDRIKIEIEDNGLEPPRAVVEAAQRRLRPILLTTATTVAGLLPLWFGGGPMWEPLAISIIFGLLFATLLTLGMVPLLYSLFFRVSFKGFVWVPEKRLSPPAG